MKHHSDPKFISHPILRTLLLAAVLCLLIAAMTGCSTEDAGQLVTKTHTISESFTRIEVDCADCSVTLVPSTDSTVTVECREREKYPHMVYVKNGCLIVEEPSRTELLNISALMGSHAEVKIYLPTAMAENCDLSLESASGNITLKDNTYREVDLSIASGNIILENIDTAHEIELEVASGAVRLTHVNCKDLDVDSASGKVDLQQVKATGDISAETASGNINLLSCDASEYHLESASGDIEGTVLSPMTFKADSLSGRVNVPNTQGGTCRIITASGNIHITVE
ncbi:MAG: DUF4097 family beta strand repeat protein [Oscillospiraceae bacterium]|nr:DUF4097 family beta strand repeat protein [Oscillospiraceae bacterium]